jgi:sterol desaturase/sphingolipid hydroxylase (fatty acid hydroxylase superfamily)
MKPEVAVGVGILLGFVVLELIFTRFFHKPGQTRSDAIVEIVSTAVLLLFTQPVALMGGAYIAAWVAPNAKDAIAAWPVIAKVGLLLIFDDLMQYWLHRLSHTVPWLYKLHRPHHNAEYLSVRVVYRNNVFYYLLMPGLWLSGALLYLGVGSVYAVYLVVKVAVIIGAHSDVRWDAPLYKIKWLSPFMYVVERVISTPATHAAHHGKHAADGVTYYKGNLGNLLFFWDVLFGTAKITRRYPERMGVEDLPDTTVTEQLLWPVVRAPAPSVASFAVDLEVAMQLEAETAQMPRDGALIDLLEAFRQPETATHVEETAPRTQWRQLAWVGIAGAAVFGVSTGLFGMSPLQIMSSMIKLPVLIFATTLACFPTFFVVQYAFSPRPLSLQAAGLLQLKAVAITALSWAVISLPLGILLASAQGYVTAKIMVTVVAALGGTLGSLFLVRGFYAAASTAERVVSRWILILYCIVFGLVGTQLAWNLRPFIGLPDEGFVLFRPLGGNLLEHLWSML